MRFKGLCFFSGVHSLTWVCPTASIHDVQALALQSSHVALPLIATLQQAPMHAS